MLDPLLSGPLKRWAESKNAIASLWLFGSRAKGNHNIESDFDFAIELRPTDGSHDWALGEYFACADQWKADLCEIVGAKVSLVGFREDIERPFDPRENGFLIWERTEPISQA